MIRTVALALAVIGGGITLPTHHGHSAPHVARCRGDVLTARQHATAFLRGGAWVCVPRAGWVLVLP